MDHFKEIFEAELYDEIMAAETVAFDQNIVLLSEGAYIKQIPLLLEGQIRVRKTDDNGKEILLYHISPGESCILSITSSLNEKTSKAEALAEVPSRVILVSSEKVRYWMDHYPSWRKFVIKLYYERLEQLLTLVDHIAFRSLDARLLENLKEKQHISGNVLLITHQQLADELGTVREVITRLLKHLEEQGKIKTLRGKIEILNTL